MEERKHFQIIHVVYDDIYICILCMLCMLVFLYTNSTKKKEDQLLQKGYFAHHMKQALRFTSLHLKLWLT
jgi:hypothetical protein